MRRQGSDERRRGAAEGRPRAGVKEQRRVAFMLHRQSSLIQSIDGMMDAEEGKEIVLPRVADLCVKTRNFGTCLLLVLPSDRPGALGSYA